jgi:nitroreductase
LDVIEAIKSRKSIRGFKKDPVPREVIHKILEVAVRAPSGVNTQPWEFVVAGAEVLDRIREENTALVNQGVLPTNMVSATSYEGVYRQRQINLAVEIFKLMGIAREDKEARHQWLLQGFRFFNSPCEIVIYTDKKINQYEDMMGVGAICQTICLAALEYGLGTCIADQGILYDQVWRKYAGIPDSKWLVAGITIGYPDPDYPANKLVSAREPVDNLVKWIGY